MLNAEVVRNFVEVVSLGFEIAGVLSIIAGATTSLWLYAMVWPKTPQAYDDLRARLVRSILLGLEFLVAADIIHTVSISPSFESLGILAIVVVIRTFLSFALEVEIKGRWPWQARTNQYRLPPFAS